MYVPLPPTEVPGFAEVLVYGRTPNDHLEEEGWITMEDHRTLERSAKALGHLVMLMRRATPADAVASICRMELRRVPSERNAQDRGPALVDLSVVDIVPTSDLPCAGEPSWRVVERSVR